MCVYNPDCVIPEEVSHTRLDHLVLYLLAQKYPVSSSESVYEYLVTHYSQIDLDSLYTQAKEIMDGVCKPNQC